MEEELRKITCCFTGHREIPAGLPEELGKKLDHVLAGLFKRGYRRFACGGALGFDTLAAQAVVRLRETHPEVRLLCVLPCRDQDRYWTREQQEEYRRLLTLADETILLSDHYFRGCMFQRNRRLVDLSSVCVSYLRQSSGGTAYTVNYAKRQGIFVIPV